MQIVAFVNKPPYLGDHQPGDCFRILNEGESKEYEMATKKTEKAESTDVAEPTESELIVQAIQGLQAQIIGATPTEREAGKDATHTALRGLYARLGATLAE